MKRLLAVVLALFVAACGNQQRPADEPDFTEEPYTPTESSEPRLGEIESLISQAKLEIKRRDYDEARVKLHQVFRRDRWNPEANTIYQDLQISSGKGDALYQEYLDLYEANKTRGDALWFHLRPLLIKRGIRACEVEEHDEPTEQQQKRIQEIKAILDGRSDDGNGAPSRKIAPGDELALIDELLQIDSWDGDAIRRRAELQPKETLSRYEKLVDESPSSGDTLYLLAMAKFGAELSFHRGYPEVAPLECLRKAWILELPGAYLVRGVAKLAYSGSMLRPMTNDSSSPRGNAAFDKESGYRNLAFNFISIASLSKPEWSFEEELIWIKVRADYDGHQVEDLSLRK